MLEPFENIVVTVGAGVTNNRAVINGAVIVNDGGTNAADVVGSVTVNSGGTNSGNVTGNLYITSSTAVNTATAVTGNIILAEGVTNALSSLVRYSGSVVQVVSGSLNATTYTGGTAGSPVTAPNGTYYNLAGDSLAYTYTSGTGALFTGAAYNLTGDLRAYSWASGVKGALYTGDIGLVSYVDGVVQTGTPYLSWTVSNDDNSHVLYTAATATSAATGTVYRNSALTVLYSGLFTEGGQNYYAPYGVAQTYLTFVVTLDSNSVNPGYLYADPMFNGGPLEYIYTEPSLTNKYTGFYKSASTYVIVAAGVVSYFTGNYLIGGLAYSIAEGDEVGLFTGNAYNLTGDSKAYSWADGVKGALFTGTIGQVSYVDGVAQAPGSYSTWIVSDDTAGNTLYTASGGSVTTGPVYTNTLLSEAYTGYYVYATVSYYAVAGAVVNYRPWTVTGDNNNGTVYTTVKAALAVSDSIHQTSALSNSTLYSANLFYTGIVGEAGYTRVLINQGVITAIEAVDHSHTTGGYYHDNATLAQDDYVYTGRYTDQVLTNSFIYIGTDGAVGNTRITIDGSGQVSDVSAVNHPYSAAGFHYNNATISQGDAIYAGQYTDQLATSGSWTIGTNGNQGYGTVSVTAGGTANISYVNHGQSVVASDSNTYYYDSISPANGDYVYAGQYSSTAATGGGTFYIGTENTQGYSKVTTSGGVMAITAVNHAYYFTASGVNIYHDNSTLAGGDRLYTGRYTDGMYTTAFTYYVGNIGSDGYTRVTQAATAGIALFTLVNHSKAVNVGSYNIYFDNGILSSGDIAYQGQYTDVVSTGGSPSWFSGTEGQNSYTVFILDSSGVLTVNVVNHGTKVTYANTDYYTDTALHNIAAGYGGSVFYTQQYGNTYVSSGTVFIISEGEPGGLLVTIGSNGSATIESINHLHTYTYYIGSSSYTAYANVNTLANGVVLYSNQYSMSPIADIPASSIGTEGVAGYGSYTTNGFGVVTITLVDHQYTTSGGIAADSAFPTAANGAMTLQTYVNRYSMQPAAATSFRVGGLAFIIDNTGNLGIVENFSGYADGQLWVSGTQIPGAFNAPFETKTTCDAPTGNTMKLSTTGLNTSDKVYKTAVNLNTVWTNITPEAYVGTFVDASNTIKYTVDNTGIIEIVACNSDPAYPD